MSVAHTDSWMKEHPPVLEADLMYSAEIDENQSMDTIAVDEDKATILSEIPQELMIIES